MLPSRRTSIVATEAIGKIINTPLEERRKILRKYSWLPDVIRIEGSIISHIVGPVLTVTIFAVLVATARIELGWDLRLSNNVVPLLSVVVGLILVFRNSTSYDRYYEGRKDFASMTAAARNLARLIWVNVATPVPPATGQQSSNMPIAKDLRRTTNLKLRAVRLLAAYPHAVMHHLRQENGSENSDMTKLLTDQLKIRTKSDAAAFSRNRSGVGRYGTMNDDISPSGGKKKSASQCKGADSTEPVSTTNGPHSNQSAPLLADLQNDVRIEIDLKDHPAGQNLPLTIAHELSRMIWKFKRAGMLDVVGPAGTNALMALVQSMVDMLTAMERVSNTPIPASYGIHLKQCVTLYLFALPFTLVNDMGYNMIPIVTVVAFTLMGIEGIANEIEMPFGRDTSDLPLEKYCDEVRQDIEYMVTHLPQGEEEDWYMRDMPQEDEDDAVAF